MVVMNTERFRNSRMQNRNLGEDINRNATKEYIQVKSAARLLCCYTM